MRTSIALPLFVFALSACSSAGQQPAPNPPAPPWRASASGLRDKDGRTVVLRGFNLAGDAKWKPYLGYQQAADYARVRTDWAMSSIRYIITWAAVEPTQGAYDDAFLAEVDERIGWAKDAGLLVVLDMHQDLFGEGFAGGDGAPAWTCDKKYYDAFVPGMPWAVGYFDPNMEHCFEALYTDASLRDRFAKAWAKVAERLVHHDNIVGFDVLNEPGWPDSPFSQYEHDQLQPLYEQVVPAVRAVAPSWVAFLEPGGSRNAGLTTTLVPFSFENVAYAPHSYDITAEGKSGFDPMRRSSVMANLASLAEEARTLDAALWIGEYGGISTLPGITDYMNAQYDGAGAVGAGTEYWSFDESDNFGFLDLDGNEKPELAAAVIRPYPERVAGDLESYAYDAATKTLSFVMTADPAITAPTIVSLPARIYPSGATVDCGGCTVTPGTGSVALTHIPAGKTTISVRPR